MNSGDSRIEPLVICDASPVILLSKVSKLHLLRELASEIWMPEPVWQEIAAGARAEELKAIHDALGFSLVQPDHRLFAAYSLLVDSGEASALALAASSESQCCLLMDDRRGRAVASAAGFRIMGTLGLLARARKFGLLSSLKAVFDGLNEAGWFIEPNLIKMVLEESGEDTN